MTDSIAVPYLPDSQYRNLLTASTKTAYYPFYMQVTDSIAAFYMTKPNDRVFILPQSMSSGAEALAARGLISRPIHEKGCRYYVSLAWRSDDDNPLLPVFIERIEKSLTLKK